MLRTTYTSLTRNTPAWRTLSTVRSFATAAPSSDEKAPVRKEKKPLSERLGAGRGKALDSSSDPFASFLASAKNNNNNNNNRGPNRRNGNFTPRQKKNDNNKKPGQFDDAEKNVAAASGSSDEPVKKRNNYSNNRNNNNNNNSNSNNNNNNNRNRRPQQQAKSTPGQGGEEKRGQRPERRNNMRRRTQPDEVRTRRATAFIDKDIDWASFDTTVTEEVVTADAVEAKEGREENNDELLLNDIQGDYDRYLTVGTDAKWAGAINPASISTLIGSNATYDYQQKAAFLASLSNATSGGAVARK